MPPAPHPPPPINTFDEAVRKVLKRALAQTAGRIFGPDGAVAPLDLKPTALQGKLRKHGIKGLTPAR